MSLFSSVSSFFSHNGTTDALTLPARTNMKNNIYDFHCPSDNTTAQLVISKSETENQTYSVFIKFLGIENARRKWEIIISKEGQAEIPSYRAVKYIGSRAFSFKITDENYIKIKEDDEDGRGIAYLDLLSQKHSLIRTLPPQPLQNLIRVARRFEESGHKTILFNDSIVVMTLNRGWDKPPAVYVGDVNSSELIKCSTESARPSQGGMQGLSVEFNGAKYLLEVLPTFGPANVSADDLKWNGNRLYVA